jgi:hypothetical protein
VFLIVRCKNGFSYTVSFVLIFWQNAF